MENGVKHVSRESTRPVPESGAEAVWHGRDLPVLEQIQQHR